MIEQLLKIRRVSEHHVEALVKAAAEDNHAVVSPRWQLEKSGEIVGFIGIMPCVHLWLHSEKMKVRDSIQVVNFYENILAESGVSHITVPCVPKSPLHPYMQPTGHALLGEASVYVKQII